MSAEVPISTGVAIGSPAPSFGGGMEGSFGQINAPMSNINIGGLNSPELNSNIFSMPELNAPSVESFNFDRAVPGNLAFTHTDILWQAPQVPNTEALASQIPPSEILDTPQAEIMREEMFFPSGNPDEIDNFKDNKINTSHDQSFEDVTQADEQLPDPFSDTIAEIASFPEPAVELEVPAIHPATERSIILDSKVISELQEIIDPDEISEPEVKDDSVKTLSLVFQEIEADAEQAEKVMNALIAIGIQEETARESAMTTLNLVLEEKGISEDLIGINEALVKLQRQNDTDSKVESDTQPAVAFQEKDESQTEELSMLTQPKEKEEKKAPAQILQKEEDAKEEELPTFGHPKEIFFAHDTKADAEREKIVASAVSQAIDKAVNNGSGKITGYDLASEMPENPPASAKSEIVKKGNDGSYDGFTDEIKSVGQINPNQVPQLTQKATESNHAVLATERPTSIRATQKEVQKVLRRGDIFDIKDTI